MVPPPIQLLVLTIGPLLRCLSMMIVLQQMTTLLFQASVPMLAVMRATRHPTPSGFLVTAPLHQQQCRMLLPVLPQQVSVSTMMCPLMTRALLVVPMYPCSGKSNMEFACQVVSMEQTLVVTCLVAIHACLTLPRQLMILATEHLVCKENMAMY